MKKRIVPVVLLVLAVTTLSDATAQSDYLKGGTVHVILSSHQDIGWMDCLEKCIAARDTMVITSRHEEGLYRWMSPDGSSVIAFSPGHYHWSGEIFRAGMERGGDYTTIIEKTKAFGYVDNEGVYQVRKTGNPMIVTLPADSKRLAMKARRHQEKNYIQ